MTSRGEKFQTFCRYQACLLGRHDRVPTGQCYQLGTFIGWGIECLGTKMCTRHVYQLSMFIRQTRVDVQKWHNCLKNQSVNAKFIPVHRFFHQTCLLGTNMFINSFNFFPLDMLNLGRHVYQELQSSGATFYYWVGVDFLFYFAGETKLYFRQVHKAQVLVRTLKC